jgi:hypothetical protein
VIATCHAKLIRRGQILDNFYDEMEEPSQRTWELAKDLFDHYGSLRADLIDHPLRKGVVSGARSFLMGTDC